MIYGTVILRAPRRTHRTSAHLGAGVGDTDVAAGVTFLGELAGEEVVQLGAEDTVSDELALLADLAGHLEVAETGKGRGVCEPVILGPASSSRDSVHPSHFAAIFGHYPALGRSIRPT